MFGYVTINRGELKVRELETYESYYCGLCRVLKDRYGLAGCTMLNYDMTFLGMLLSSLYEEKEEPATSSLTVDSSLHVSFHRNNNIFYFLPK